MGNRGVIGDKWSMRILWMCAIGTAVDRQEKNRDRMMAESIRAAEAEAGNGENV
uniref:Uncharacterized protein n=1 Tax=Rhizophora mucronata TaxID=61149 RepID=A0A2P2KAB3_RHIMU